MAGCLNILTTLILSMQRNYIVYDFADRLPRLGFMLFPLMLIALGLRIYFYHKKYLNGISTSTLK